MGCIRDTLLVGLIVGVTATACGDASSGQHSHVATDVVEGVSEPGTSTDGSVPPLLVAAGEVVIVGQLDPADRALTVWSLDRFDQANLLLPSQIEVVFDPTRTLCGGTPGRCRPASSPPVVIVCRPEGNFAQLIDRRITMLHELAHVWHQAHRYGWLNFQDIVGGRLDDPSSAWADRTEERVAVVISWGLMDQLRRPVRSDLPCADLYEQFAALTGQEPLGPIEIACRPPVSLVDHSTARERRW